jgi:hypothetical protein
MRASNHNRPEMQCMRSSELTTEEFERATTPGLVMDVRDLRFEDASFDVVIDKGKAVRVGEGFGLTCVLRYNGRNDDGQRRPLGTSTTPLHRRRECWVIACPPARRILPNKS